MTLWADRSRSESPGTVVRSTSMYAGSPAFRLQEPGGDRRQVGLPGEEVGDQVFLDGDPPQDHPVVVGQGVALGGGVGQVDRAASRFQKSTPAARASDGWKAAAARNAGISHRARKRMDTRRLRGRARGTPGRRREGSRAGRGAGRAGDTGANSGLSRSRRAARSVRGRVVLTGDRQGPMADG
jgi:hypothetical protein